MRIQADHEAERSEAGAVLASGIFVRAPNLAHIFEYICAKYFEGSPEKIKEYNIAVEALGRAADFDQTRDSIVRVEAHRLRKRLREYYQTEGADHVCHIEIPSGQYAPRFVHKDVPAAVAPVATEVEVVPTCEDGGAVILGPVPPNSRKWLLAGVMAGGIVLISTIALMAIGRVDALHAGKVPVVPGATDEIRILAGAMSDSDNNYVDVLSHAWRADRFYSGGSAIPSTTPHPISGTNDPRIYQTRREGTFSYDIPLGPGIYEMRLYFAELLYGENNIAGGGETSRIFEVSANGRRILDDFDVIADVGPSAADVKVFKDISPAPDGKLHLKFEPKTNPAFLNGIEIVPGIPGRMRPIRMVARSRGLSDQSGQFWDADRFVKGGQLVVRNEQISGTSEPELYHGERFGNITYTVPVVTPGRYTLSLHFVESWFGPDRPGGGGDQSRVFDILANGVALRRSFDLFKESGGPNRATTLVFHNLPADPRGKLTISLLPSRNYACINALQIEEERN